MATKIELAGGNNLSDKPTKRLLPVAFFVGILLVVCLATGCDTTRAKSKQLSRVAKDWSLVVRASQVIPIYPLTEDLLPGDVLLVSIPISEQIKEYEDKGFLALDQLLVRIQPTNYTNFYLGAYGIESQTNTPYHWKFPATNDLVKAPRAAFPSYSFSVSRGGGLNLALPVQGVPVAMSLLGAAKAQGNIVIADAYTYGVDEFSLRNQIHNWATNQKAFLSQFEPQTGYTNYLRVVSRVYWTGRVNISMSTDEAWGGAASAGAARPVNIPFLENTNAGVNYSNVLAKLSDSLANSASPGGSLKVAAASSRSISLVETFPRPLVIGYLAFDLPILPGGAVGAPVSTKARLSKIKLNPVASYGVDDYTSKIQAWMKKNEENPKTLNKWLNANHLSKVGVTGFLRRTDMAPWREKFATEHDI